jgi:DNA primase
MSQGRETRLARSALRNTNRQHKIKMTDIDSLKARFAIPLVWEHFGLPGRPSRQCRSPFREDKAPSFSVFNDGRRWKDFSTGEGGDAIDFVAKVKSCTNGEAIKYLQDISGETPP